MELNGDDFEKWFLGTIIRIENTYYRVRERKGPSVFMLSSIPADHFRTMGIGEAFDPFFPDTGLYNLEKEIIHLTKTGARQWKKSFCNGSYHSRILFYEQKKQIVKKIRNKWKVNVSPENILIHTDPNNIFEVLGFSNLFSPYPTIREVVDRIKKFNVLGQAVSRELCVASNFKQDILLYFFDYPIAQVSDTHISIIDSVFKQEVQDFIRRTNQYYSVY